MAEIPARLQEIADLVYSREDLKVVGPFSRIDDPFKGSGEMLIAPSDPSRNLPTYRNWVGELRNSLKAREQNGLYLNGDTVVLGSFPFLFDRRMMMRLMPSQEFSDLWLLGRSAMMLISGVKGDSSYDVFKPHGPVAKNFENLLKDFPEIEMPVLNGKVSISEISRLWEIFLATNLGMDQDRATLEEAREFIARNPS